MPRLALRDHSELDNGDINLVRRREVQVDITQVDPALKALVVFQLLQSTVLSSRWFQASTCTPTIWAMTARTDSREIAECSRGAPTRAAPGARTDKTIIISIGVYPFNDDRAKNICHVDPI